MNRIEIIEETIKESFELKDNKLVLNEEKALSILNENSISEDLTILNKIIDMVNKNKGFLKMETEDLIKQADLLLKLNL